MELIKIITKENEYIFGKDDIKLKSGLKTKTHTNVTSYLINNNYVVISSDKIVFECDICKKEVIKTYSNFKNRKHDLCISCTRKKTVTEVHKNMNKEDRKELNDKISKTTKIAMNNITPEKRLQMTEKMLKSMNWDIRNKHWLETMSNKSNEEKKEIGNKISQSLKKRYKEQGPWNLSKKYSGSRYSAIDCKYYTRGLHSSNEVIEVKCDSCKNIFKTIRMAAARQEREHPGFIQCNNCVRSAKSIKEKEIVNWLIDIGIKNINENTRKIINPLELDIFLPDYNLAIEFNGLYWHSDLQRKDKNYHLNKTIKCEEQGIQLIHIFQDIWEYKNDIVKARLKNILNLNSKRIGARKTVVKKISAKTKNIFLETYHIQGKDAASVKLGAYYGKELIGVMTFAQNRIFSGKKKDDSWELSRFATISNTYTPGLASKMLKHFEKNYEWNTIYSFADRCWSQGNLYYKLNFEFDKQTAPSYWYAYNGQSLREHRYNYRKQNLTKFNNFSLDKTEKQIMNEAGYLRIYDCGTYKFIKIKKGV